MSRTIAAHSQYVNTSLTIGQSSLLHLPVSSEPIGTAKNLYLDNFPSMFITDRNLADLAFVVPANDPTSWDYAAKIAYYIGAKGGISVADFKVVFGEDVPEDIRAERNLIMVGKASTLPIISEINDQLPAPFEAGKDEAIQPAMLVNYRLLPNVSVGSVQLLTSPWASDRAILTVMGNTDQGIPMAGEVLVKDNLVNQLNGNFSILYGDQILTTDTRLGLVKEGVVGGLPRCCY
ncbi:MAG: cellulose biosynthesis cyclic di-GMP-binding regulatory protein BcsB [Anaerolineales bacterium]|nr:cellulose biosynthesis cyclic di-GMP-binding regulatory protein BcsB [Anaerolineales bacterium]